MWVRATILALILCHTHVSHAFVIRPARTGWAAAQTKTNLVQTSQPWYHQPTHQTSRLILQSTPSGGGGGKKRKRKRKRKRQPQSQAQAPTETTAAAEAPTAVAQVKEQPPKNVQEISPPAPPKQKVEDVAAATPVPEADATPLPMEAEPLPPPSKFKFNREEAVALGIKDGVDEESNDEALSTPPTDSAAQPLEPPKPKRPTFGNPVELPDLKDSVKKRKTKKDAAKTKQTEEEKEKESRKRISRKDIASVTKLLEVEPNADTDASYFEEEAYGTVSALLGEGAKTFLGLPLPILQVGHFMGALGIILMAYVDYPGFPLTNLPSPIRGALQGGLASVFAINTVLAVLAAFKAGERGQPIPVWVAKTFTVGGLAYDQLTQLPTEEEMRMAAAARGGKGKRRRR